MAVEKVDGEANPAVLSKGLCLCLSTSHLRKARRRWAKIRKDGEPAGGDDTGIVAIETLPTEEEAYFNNDDNHDPSSLLELTEEEPEHDFVQEAKLWLVLSVLEFEALKRGTTIWISVAKLKYLVRSNCNN